MGDEDDSHPFILEISHQTEQLFHFLFVQRRRGLIQNQHLTLHIHRPGNGNHLLHRNGTALQLLDRLCGYVQ